MIRHSTVRLPLAVGLVVGGVMAAVMLGRPEIALFAAPWVALLVLGLTRTELHRVRARAEPAADRIVVGDNVELRTIVQPDTRGWVEVSARPEPTFWADVDPTVDREVWTADVVEPGRPTELTITLPSPGWGSHDVGRVDITLHESYGLFDWSGSVTESRRVRVHPRPVDLRRLLTPWLVRRQTGAHESTAVERGIEFADIRPFGAGDSLRDINWRASARSEELMVSQRHPERSTDVILLIDSFVESGHDVRSVVGLAIEAAVGLAQSHLALTDRVGLVELGGVVRWVSPGTGRHQLQRLTDALLGTRLYANATERDLTVIPPRALPPRSFVVAITPLLDPRFVDALHVLRGSGHDVAVIECVYEPPVLTADSTDLAVAATALFNAERMVVLDRLADRGVAVSQWRRGEHLDPVLSSLTARRRRTARFVR